MASILPHENGYRAQVYVKGKRETRLFRTKREATAWASARETALREEAEKLPGERYTLRDALREYARTISPKKRGQRWELIRLNAFERQDCMPVGKPLSAIGSDDLCAWRDNRLKTTAPGSVRREITLLSDVFEIARREWRWIAANPMRDVKRPPSPAHRDRVISRGEICAMLRALKYRASGKCVSVTQAIAIAFLVALRTGMRAGELCGLTWARIKEGYCELPVTKTTARNVPLDWKARRLIERMRGFDDELVFGLQPQTLDARFRYCQKKAGLSGWTFHDSRHTAATWIGQSRKLDPLELCRMFGWTNLKQAMTYFNASAASIARRLSAPRSRGQSVR